MFVLSLRRKTPPKGRRMCLAQSEAIIVVARSDKQAQRRRQMSCGVGVA
jgi:hypothetical protein